MGTSHRHKASLVGQPNWGNASKAVTGVAVGIKKIEVLADAPSTPLTPRQTSKVEKQTVKYSNQIHKNYHHAVRNLVRAAGGRNVVSSGTSHAVGFAGVQVAGSLYSVLNDITSCGLTAWLRKRGITSLEGKSCKDVLDVIQDYIGVDVAGLDDTAANEALSFVLERIETKVGDNVSALEYELENTNLEDVKNLIDEFFGMYIFSHLSQDFMEKLEYEKGVDNTAQTMVEIKEMIISDIQFGRATRPVENINWNSDEGEVFIRREFNRILYILSGNED